MLGEVIGEGAFGVVLKGQLVNDQYLTNLDNKSTNQSINVAIKTLKDGSSEKDLLDLVQELKVLKMIGRHENIINFIGCCTERSPLLVVVEYAPHGNLKDFLRKRRKKFSKKPLQPHGGDDGDDRELTYGDLLTFAEQIAEGMQYLASKMCIHRDLAARNILVGHGITMKICDFGLSRNIHNNDYYKKFSDGRLPIKWMSPEALFDRKYTPKSDVWSYGVLLWEIFSLGGTPYPGVSIEKIFYLVKQGYRMERPVHASMDMYGVMLDCWMDDPTLRPSFKDIINQIRKNKIQKQENNKTYLGLTPLWKTSASSDSQYISMATTTTNTSTNQSPVSIKTFGQSEESVLQN
ncbi:hypothetical protein HELRODRAFT_102694 [Helobdella robusta]|uniref:Protein kinase domain-containing protein n=1 Tax=Helobdella robusta TaxID=6412 RepID=T1EDB0_HELRO|nr:hypothetical protein HELRODRAFT_102694 [Helobdella robusta]ESN95083.1 hypothetical protein HELRODRAFT_102694 [Helobdella robusta]